MQLRTALPLIALTLGATPALAADLTCTVDSICPGGSDCAAPEAATVIVLHGIETDSPVMIREGEDIALTRSHDGAIRRWSGKNMTGETEVLALRTADNAFTGLVIFEGATHQKTTGRCEVK